ncbi:unnamed protein product [Chondrus crispus]|uniref:Uncharacterized protein n=1 Tax=Chondrus crispus TaxID=2769 RepID=R7Q4Q9_CHOCR|nr:unnamed protein product [Chondrus crispus]CDF33512.1 unnamed protein product [Chondrus crispus]|eukprot:XP_005713315.1 unnamed protein product [Chondrus crispus]
MVEFAANRVALKTATNGSGAWMPAYRPAAPSRETTLPQGQVKPFNREDLNLPLSTGRGC